MKLQTKILIQKETKNQINYNSKVLLLGSCFSENIGNKFNYFKFQSLQNPFGILFHPIAIENLVTNVINQKKYTEEDLIYQNEIWHSFDAHSSLSSLDKNEILNHLNSAITSTNKKLEEASHIVITLGTSWVYRHIESDKIVVNCHKIPQKKFLKELLSVDEITESLEAIIALIKSINKNVSILFTVSPVRHFKDGFIENTQSKSHLITAIHQIIDERKNTHYFPSYEIMMDELRDYRFYNEDMIHPNKTAINYIWERFIATWFSDKTKATLKEIDAIQRGILHRPFNESSEQHQQFLNNLEAKKDKIQKEFSFIKF
ncbi:GSCFA domain-containing protein [Polaribacter reichenbachii]|uniref:GSCFA domain-containing protein n=1 Tax=Polaribacter reichenbachii TaxID=996801 RepID=A0A1B8U672_9FLAO|nr:GSCFA domain-containing protein [Polaribacter reichenbachii]APZ46197.1 GSCFA domain-containing protein [Polaribacter reichenbachii]AUC20059.1 GSCFA domain-containing protein [Polaribacter reichenbachii]OBY67393.1 GSCFA domain-containing protein [Polaribacter reichenbachii]